MNSDPFESEFVHLLDELVSDHDTDEVSSRSNSECDTSLIQKYKRCKANTKQKKRKIEVIANDGNKIEFEAYFPNPSSAVKYDIRRSYANMMINVLNTGDFRMFFGFFDNFCVPSFTHKISRTIEDNSVSRSITSSNKGLINSTTKWQFAVSRTPDASFRIKDTTIFTKKDGSESKLVCNFIFQATKIYDDAADDIPDEALYRSSEDDTNIDSSFGGDRQAMLDEVFNSVNKYNKTRLVLRAKPKSINAEGVIVLWMDSECMLTKMEMNTRSN